MSTNRSNEDEGAREARECIQAYYNRGYEPPRAPEPFNWQRWISEHFTDDERAAFDSTGLFELSEDQASGNPLDCIQRYYDRRRD